MKFFASICIFTTAIAAATSSSSSSSFLVHAHSNGDNAVAGGSSSSRMQRVVRRNVIDLSSHSAKQGQAHAHARRSATLIEVRQDKMASTVSNGTDTTTISSGTRKPATLGEVVDKQGLGEFAKGSPYNVASAIQLIKEGAKPISIIDSDLSSHSANDDNLSSTGFVRRQERKDVKKKETESSSSTTSAKESSKSSATEENEEDDEDDDEEECDTDNGDDDEDCDADEDDDDDEECEEDDDEEECEEDDGSDGAGDDDEEECDADSDDEDCEDDGDDADDASTAGENSGKGTNAAIGAAVNLTTTKGGDSSNLAEGSLTAEKGCTKFATAKSGDSCYGLIGAEDDDALKAFYKANPSVDNDCQNLEIGVTYCIASS